MYVITQGGVKEDSRSKLYKIAKFEGKQETIVNNLERLGVQLNKDTSLTGKISNFFSAFKKTKSSEVSFVLSRYVTKLKEVAEELLKGSLSTKDFPYYKSPGDTFKLVDMKSIKKDKEKDPKEEDDDKQPETASLRSRKPTTTRKGPAWGEKADAPTTTTTTTSSLLAPATSSKKASDKKLIIFMLGGLTHGESRTAWELEKEYSLDVYCGGTSILTPKLFLDKLANLSK